MITGRPADLIPVTEAHKPPGAGPAKTFRLLKEGTIRHFFDLLDRRVKLVSESEVLSLIDDWDGRRAHPPGAARPYSEHDPRASARPRR